MKELGLTKLDTVERRDDGHLYVVRTGTEFFPEIRSIDIASGLSVPVNAVPKTTDLSDPERFIRSDVVQSSEPFKIIKTFDTYM